jgi:hypothetical protein
VEECANSWGSEGNSSSKVFPLPSLASLSASSFPAMFVWACTLCVVSGKVRSWRIFTMSVRSSLSRWLFYCVDV